MVHLLFIDSGFPRAVVVRTGLPPTVDEADSRHAAAPGLAPVDWSDCLVAIAHERDKTRFALLFEYFAPRLKAFFLRLGTGPIAAEELTQEAMLLVWRKAGSFDPARAAASTWIFTIARNLRIDAKRRERDIREYDPLFGCEGDMTPVDHLLAMEREVRVRAALANLPHNQALAIRLSFFENRSQTEIASALNLSLGTVKSRVRLAMEKLRVLVEDLQ